MDVVKSTSMVVVYGGVANRFTGANLLAYCSNVVKRTVIITAEIRIFSIMSESEFCYITSPLGAAVCLLSI